MRQAKPFLQFIQHFAAARVNGPGANIRGFKVICCQKIFDKRRDLISNDYRELGGNLVLKAAPFVNKPDILAMRGIVPLCKPVHRASFGFVPYYQRRRALLR